MNKLPFEFVEGCAINRVRRTSNGKLTMVAIEAPKPPPNEMTNVRFDGESFNEGKLV